MADMGLVVVGAGGRMGRMLVKTISETEGCTLAGAIEQPGSIALGEDAGLLAGAGRANLAITDDPDSAFAHADGVLDFTAPAASVGFAEIAAKTGIVHVVGTTGLEESHFARLRAAAARARIVQSGNMSLGVNLLAALVRKVAATLGEEFDIEVLEMHHRMKVDAPSGTGLLFGEAAAAGPVERIELTHKAEDRGLFARGAIRAALWARDQKPGYYTMADVLGLSDL